MKVLVKHKFLTKVKVVHDEGNQEMIVTDLQIKPDGTVIYGCLCQDGDTKWFRSYELASVSKKKNLGYSLILQ